MDIDQAILMVKEVITGVVEHKALVTDETHLIGGNAVLDSMKLVEVCLMLEDIADENGFEFDWTSEATMSKSRSMFRDIRSLSEELVNQANG
mgnify:CR=1 FL=1